MYFEVLKKTFFLLYRRVRKIANGEH